MTNIRLHNFPMHHVNRFTQFCKSMWSNKKTSSHIFLSRSLCLTSFLLVRLVINKHQHFYALWFCLSLLSFHRRLLPVCPYEKPIFATKITASICVQVAADRALPIRLSDFMKASIITWSRNNSSSTSTKMFKIKYTWAPSIHSVCLAATIINLLCGCRYVTNEAVRFWSNSWYFQICGIFGDSISLL